MVYNSVYRDNLGFSNPKEAIPVSEETLNVHQIAKREIGAKVPKQRGKQDVVDLCGENRYRDCRLQE